MNAFIEVASMQSEELDLKSQNCFIVSMASKNYI